MNDFERGYMTARLQKEVAEGESRAFWDGYEQYMHEEAFFAGNPDIDSFDY